MPSSDASADAGEIGDDVDLVVAEGPSGALAIFALAVALVIAIYLTFCVFVYLPGALLK